MRSQLSAHDFCSPTHTIVREAITVFHSVGSLPTESCGLVLDKSYDHAVEIEEEHDQVEAEFDE